MTATKPTQLTAFTDQKRLLTLWKGVIAAGLLFFGGLLLLSYFLLNSPSVILKTVFLSPLFNPIH